MRLCWLWGLFCQPRGRSGLSKGAAIRDYEKDSAQALPALEARSTRAEQAEGTDRDQSLRWDGLEAEATAARHLGELGHLRHLAALEALQALHHLARLGELRE